jgi:broad specificity phosphatase PhoE
MTPGDSTLQLVEQLIDEGADHIVLLMRHSAREYAADKHDLLNPLTDEGRDLAKSLGERLPKSLRLRGYSSPAERCVETADLIMAGHQQAGGDITRNRVIEALGVFYVLDQMKMFMAMRDAGGIVELLDSWFAGKVANDILMPSDIAARLIGRLAEEKLKQAPAQPQLDLLVSHDFTLYTIKDRLLGQSTSRYPNVHFLDGVAFFLRDGQTWVQSHHEDAIALNVALPEFL